MKDLIKVIQICLLTLQLFSMGMTMTKHKGEYTIYNLFATILVIPILLLGLI